MIVVDAGVLVYALANDGPVGARCRARLDAETARAPALIDNEVIAALRRMCAHGMLSPRRAKDAVDDLVRSPLPRVDQRPLLRRVWELRDNVSAYDAVYVALAELSQATLLTTDARLARAPGITCDVEVLT